MADVIPIESLPDLPARPVDGHKGTFGTVIVIGGSPTMLGAPALSARSALRSGAGLCKIATKQAVLSTAITIEPGATGIVLGESLESNLALIKDADPDHKAVLAIGPGLGRSDAMRDLVMALLFSPWPIVLDADGLNLLAATGRHLNNAPMPAGGVRILTPHPGEFARLAAPLGITASPISSGERVAAAAELALAHGAVVVLKGQHSVVTDGHVAYVNQTGNPAMAVAGSGDVLTGCVAAILAQFLVNPPAEAEPKVEADGASESGGLGDPRYTSNLSFDAACLGVCLHGLAGDHWAQAYGLSGLSALDLADGLPGVFDQLRRGTT